MKARVLVTLEEIDNGWLNLARKASTCAVAQALVNADIVSETGGADVLNDTVLLRLPSEADKSVFTVSQAFSEWIRKFDRWTAVRRNYQDWRQQCDRLRRAGRTDFPPMPATKGTPVPPVTVIIDTQELHVSIEGEPASKGERVALPRSYRDRYLLNIRDNFESILELDSDRFNSLCRYLHVVGGGQVLRSARKMGPPSTNKPIRQSIVKHESISSNAYDVQADVPEKSKRAALISRMRKAQIGAKRPNPRPIYTAEYQKKVDGKS